ncbi:HNH endonuclease [Bacillus thuringiensis]|uniref:HNH endonuclease n=1 Tax=Bacillus thuringiensis TaxID=1428 RepID=A0AAW9GD83_BACTU|nr:HNH endonuclease [Bacillus thuringiensis]MDY0850430.1 HNH endonuclease [Bacillus thuringiensis]MDY4389213.1 HNH endonuclease [Bacillus thuringiensis]
MNKVILQPAGKGEFNYSSTMNKGIDLSEIQVFLKKNEFERLSQIYKNGKVHVWGVKPARDNSNVKQWNKIERGDIALFYGERHFFASASVTYKIHNSKLARYLWGEKEAGVTWEYLYFLDEIKNQYIHINLVNELLKYKSKDHHVQRIRVLNQEKSNEIMNTFDFDNTMYLPDISKWRAEKDLEVIIDELEQNVSLEREVKGRARREQNIIRGYLFGTKKVCSCGICGEEYPVDLLVAAHIKKRAHCSRQEKLDIKHIAIPMCKFGCDDLFEKGYIGVQKGEVISLLDTEYLPKSVKDYIENIQGKACDSWNIDNDKYFEWHTNYHTKEF